MRVLPGWSLPVNDSFLIMVVFLIKIKNKIKNINVKSDDSAWLGFCLVWVAWWHQVVRPEHWEGGESDLAGSALIGLIVTWVEWQSISPLWSWPGILFCWYFHEQSPSHSPRSTGQPRPSLPLAAQPPLLAAGAQCHILSCQQHLLTIMALYAPPGSYYLGETQEYEAKKRKSQVQDTKDSDLVALAEKYPDSPPSIKSPNWNPTCSKPSA